LRKEFEDYGVIMANLWPWPPRRRFWDDCAKQHMEGAGGFIRLQNRRRDAFDRLQLRLEPIILVSFHLGSDGGDEYFTLLAYGSQNLNLDSLLYATNATVI